MRNDILTFYLAFLAIIKKPNEFFFSLEDALRDVFVRFLLY